MKNRNFILALSVIVSSFAISQVAHGYKGKVKGECVCPEISPEEGRRMEREALVRRLEREEQAAAATWAAYKAQLEKARQEAATAKDVKEEAE